LPPCFKQSELFIKPISPHGRTFDEDPPHTNFLQNLKRGSKVVQLPGDSGLSVIELDSTIPEIPEIPNTQIFVRSFYPELFAKIRKGGDRAIVIGNPGIGKSCFQW
jgi:hypothetical protein